MAKARIPIEQLAQAYTIAQESNVAAAARKTQISSRTIHSLLWAMDVAPKVAAQIQQKSPGGQSEA